MPRTTTVELQYLPLAQELVEIKAAKEYLGELKANKFQFKAVPLYVEQPLEPIIFRLVIPKLIIKKLNASVTFFLEDVTGAAQIIQEWIVGGSGALTSVATLLERRFIPANEASVEPAVEQERKYSVSAETSAETAEIPANTTKCVAYWQVLGLARQ